MWRLFNSMRDMYSNVTLILTAVIVIVLTQVNPKAKSAEESVKPPGELMVCIYWTGHHDVDLWGGSPDDPKGTGYSRKSGKTIDLVRDDLGTDNVPHFECEFARQLPDGLWAYNVHGYSLTEPVVSVHAEIRLGGGADGFKLIYETTLDIKQKQERTIAQFRLAGGKVITESLNTVFKPLRSAK
jgi:hypothetical protein